MAQIDDAQPKPVKALVLSGGGARGAYEAGVVSQLYARGETFDIICGTSIGAINGALIAQRPRAETLADIWHAISTVGVIKEIPLVASAQKVLADLKAANDAPTLAKVGDVLHALADARGLFPLSQFLTLTGGLDPIPVATFLAQHLDFSRLLLPFVCAATNLTQGSSQTFYHFPASFGFTASFLAGENDTDTTAIPLSALNYAEAVRASGSIPIAFPPVAVPALPDRLAGSLFVDGGVANNTPIGQAVHAGADEVTVIFMDPATNAADHYPAGNLLQIAAACYSVMAQTILENDFCLALEVNQRATIAPAAATIADKAAGTKRQIGLREIRPAAALPLTILDFDKQDLIDRAFAIGQADGANPPPYRY